MKNLKLHAAGKENYLNALRDEFVQLVFKIKTSTNLTITEKEIELKKAKEEFEEKMKDSNGSLF